MAKYTTRACHKCGIRKPQPEMYKKEIYVESGRSRSGVSGSTILASMLGDKKAEKQVYNSIWNTRQRTYQRKKTVWACGSCVGRVKNSLGIWETFRKIMLFIMYTVLIIFAILAIAAA